MCNSPVPMYQSVLKDERGKSTLTSRLPPFAYIKIAVPCGSCPECLQARSFSWAVRAYQESQLHERNSFITLTYDDAHLPEGGLLVKEDLQKFFKRVRRSGMSIRYLACGEYGEQTRRPHYHALIFGQDFHSPNEQKINDQGDFNSPILSDFWPMGFNVVAPVTMATCCYVAGYVFKKQGDPDTCRLFSKTPAIGKPWFDKYGEDVLRTGKCIVEGKSVSLPPQYFDWSDDCRLTDLKAERAAHAKKVFARRQPETRFSRAANARSRLKNRGGSL